MKVGTILVIVTLLSMTCLAQRTPRVAIVDFPGDDGGDLRALLQVTASEFEPLDAAQTRAAVRGAGYQGSLNLTRAEASDLGASLGCDFYFLGRVRNLRRLGSEREAYFEASAAIFLVEAQTGRLLLFDLPTAKEPSEAEGNKTLMKTVEASLARYSKSIREGFARRVQEASDPVETMLETVEVLDGEVVTKGVAPPVFYQRLKPVYTVEAALAEVTATVELRAIFAADGKVSRVDVVKWAGYGLDESATATVRSIKFKPAQRDGRAVSVLALVRYNFVRPPSTIEREIEAERLRRSLRTLGRP